MSIVIPTSPGVVGDLGVINDVRAASPVRGPGQWEPWAQAQLWLAGRGAQLASIGPSVTITGAGGALGLYVHCEPHPQIRNWLWILTMYNESGQVNGTFTGAQGTVIGNWTMSQVAPYCTQTFMFTEAFAAEPAKEFTAVVTNTSASGTAYCKMASLQAVELPAFSLSTFGSSGAALVDPSTCRTNMPIYEPSSGNKSANGLARVVANETDGAGMLCEGRRAHLFSWAHSGLGITVTATTYPGVSQFFSSDPRVLSRSIVEGASSRSVRVAIAALATGGAHTGAVRIAAAKAGTSVSVAVTATTYAWYYADLAIECEDLDQNATDGGLRGGTRESLLIEGKVTGGTTSLTVRAVYVVEKA